MKNNNSIVNDIPWELKLIVFRGIGRDVLRGLGVRPGKITVPPALCEALGRSFEMHNALRNSYEALIPIEGTNKRIRLTMRPLPWVSSSASQKQEDRMYDREPNPKESELYATVTVVRVDPKHVDSVHGIVLVEGSRKIIVSRFV
jgi:hypothetical protein